MSSRVVDQWQKKFFAIYIFLNLVRFQTVSVLICFQQLGSLQEESDRLSKEKPEEAAAIQEKMGQIKELWQDLREMVRDLCGLPFYDCMHGGQLLDWI